jgi:hypothetical protein
MRAPGLQDSSSTRVEVEPGYGADLSQLTVAAGAHRVRNMHFNTVAELPMLLLIKSSITRDAGFER